MKTLSNRIHAVAVAVAYAAVGVHCYGLPGDHVSDTANRPEPWLLDIGTTLALIASVVGFIMMARRSGKSESILLAISTVAAFVLLGLSCGPRF